MHFRCSQNVHLSSLTPSDIFQRKADGRRINKLISDTTQSPFSGIGKPEALKEYLAGFWSRRIDDSHRLVYAVTDTHIMVISCKYHYEKG
ncbi:MAG: Txe/YoeB family addiction module toxin [Zetaproteobacteria bacterium CG_4_9_14_3_um_filter_49_83]|nr:MAG: Txe/YoeB family addiction module toxin [Zetaproteobacteria bacterium CG17_big_fil_post_rev_8_21_14_2_50_50_13]PIV30043.1 MAG: Txe/YoeB family addiction module toxin [Zetaproteobacteria bacterium CG02_land_8_20_14_3_00_50_9]PIY55490.1 MAG: Txe/YoeB family addiction module toxin [Zetaproteobacteria bacterium CG_4_10_14_0_8_um_filter_49_80]PJA34846.1 MAG: Txe/YoeB family addiction module toxin [Zetaproteobacteria bacterium CG_4_9_14_3_um_filter_49_83]